MGRPARGFFCGVGQRISGRGKLFGLFRRPVGHHRCRSLYLNALPFLYDWIRYSRWRAFLKAAALFAAAAAAHHATLLFGSFFFAIPVVALAFMEREEGERVSTSGIVLRTVVIVAVVAAAVIVVLLPFWIALFHYPVTQTPIPHPSRANYILARSGA